MYALLKQQLFSQIEQRKKNKNKDAGTRGQAPRPRPSPCLEGHNASAPASQQKLARPRFNVRIRTRSGLSLGPTTTGKRILKLGLIS